MALLWHHPFDCQVISYSRKFINVEVSVVGRPLWRFIGFYDYPESGRRRDFWDLLRNLARDNDLSWCVMGDFNDILSNNDISGKQERSPWLIRCFQEAVEDS